MALDKEFFDSINIEVVKKKYYNANKVEAVFSKIREEAEALNAENAALKERNSRFDKQRDDITDVMLIAREVCNRMVEEAQAKSDEIIAAAEAEKREIIRNGIRRQDYSVQKVEECFSKLREIQLSSIDMLNTQWQEFLMDLPDGDLSDADDEYDEETTAPLQTQAKAQTQNQVFIPEEDLTEKVNAIVDQILAMHNAMSLDDEDEEESEAGE